MKKCLWAVLFTALLLAFSIGCVDKAGKTSTDPQADGSETVQQSNGNPANGFAVEGKENAEKEQEPETPVDSNPQYEGVYSSETGSVVIRYVSDEMCDFIVLRGEDGEEGYLAGVAQLRDGLIVYEAERYALEISVSFDTLTLSESGTNPYSKEGFSGEYQRTGNDPYAVETRASTVMGELPDTMNHTLVNGEPAILYIDPENRFTVTLPDVFGEVSDDAEDGILSLSGVEGDVFAEIDSTGAKVSSSEELKSQLENSIGVTGDLYVDGRVSLEYSTEEENGETYITVLLAHPLEESSLLVSYRFLASQEEYFRPLVDQISINIS